MVDYNTPVGQIRLLIADVDTGDNQIFTDEQLEGYLGITDHSVKRAAADALDAIATSEALISKVITTQDRSSDGRAVADALRKHADALRKRAQEEEDVENGEPFFLAFNLTDDGSQEGEEARL